MRACLARCLLLSVLLGACEQSPQFRITFNWEDPPPDNVAELYVVMRVEADGAVLAQSAPTRFGDGVKTNLEFALGTARVVVVEIRDGPDPSSHILYYGLSEPFDARAGETVDVVVALRLRATPGEDLSMEVVGAERGYTSSADVELRLRGGASKRVQISDTSGFAAGRTESFELDTEVLTVPWTLDRFASCEGDERCVRQVHARFIDDRGYMSRTLSSGDIVIDAVPPSIVASSVDVLFVPSDKNLRRDPTAVGPQTNARISFSTNETLATTPTVTVDGTSLRLRRIAGNVASFTYELAGTDVTTEGAFVVSVSMVDLAGNTSTEPLSAALQLDPEAPSPPSFAAGAVVLERAPFGAARTNGEASMAVVGAAGAVEPGAVVLFYSQAEVSSASLLGRLDADSQGAFSGPLLDQGDRAFVYTVVVDGAGNPSDDDASRPGLQGSRILDTRWTASVFEPGSTPNPHRLTGHVSVGRGLPEGGFDVEPLSPYLLEANRLWRVTRRPDVLAANVASIDAAAYDARRDRIVVLHRELSGSMTYELDGDVWLDRTVEGATAPPQRTDAAMAYDAARGVALLFGGVGTGSELLGDTWAWDGREWRELRPPGPLPLPRSGHVMVFDERRGRVVMFGGGRIDLVNPPIRNDVWEWDGTRWLERADFGADVPERRIFSSAVYDANEEKVVLFGGCARIGSGRVCADALGDTWRYDGASWEQVVTATNPPPAVRPTMVFDPESGEAIMLPDVARGGPGGAAQPTWRFDGQDWSPGADAPFEWRTAPAATTRTTRGDVVFSGGCLGGNLSFACFGPVSHSEETWRLADGTWQRVVTSTVWPAQPTRAATVPGDDRTLVLSPEENGDYGVYAWDGASWSPADTLAGSRPVARNATTWAHDPIGGGVLLSGGTDHQDIWRFANGQWSVVTASAATLPDARAPGGVWAPQGITVPGGPENDIRGVWRWTGTEWTAIPATAGLEAPFRDRGNVARYDPVTGSLLMFGGSWNEAGVGIRFYDELWAWDGLGWTQQVALTRPVRRRAYAFAHDTRANRTILYGGRGQFDPILRDTWAWDGTGWRELVDDRPDVDRPPGYGVAFYDEAREAVTMIYGDELWALLPEPEARPGVLFAASWDTAGLPSDGITTIDVAVDVGGSGADTNGDPLDGAEVLLWDAWGSRWVSVATNDAPWNARGLVTASTTLGPRAVFGFEGRIYVMLRPRGAVGTQEVDTRIGAASVELTVHHRDLPDQR